MTWTAGTLNPSLVRRLEQIALRVAEAGAAVHRAGLEVVTERKASYDLVTNIDRLAETTMVETIDSLRPGDGILGEEGATRVGSTEVRWVLDPLDGTANFALGSPARCVSVGVEVHGEPVVGVIIDTGRGDVFTGSVSSPARRDGSVIRVVEAGWSEAVIATGFSPDPERRRHQASFLAELLPEVRDLRRTGSPALDLAGVAAGWTHGFYEGPLGRWDYVAGAVIVRAAGGRVTTAFDGHNEVVLAGSGSIVDELRRRLHQ